MKYGYSIRFKHGSNCLCADTVRNANEALHVVAINP